MELLRQAFLLDKLDVFCHYVITLGTVPRQLVYLVSLEDIGACSCQIQDNLELACVGR